MVKNIIIVGGGSAGVSAAKTLSRTVDPSQYQLILINPLPYRIWLIATLRLTVSHEEGLQEQMMLPYDKVFANGNGKFIEGAVASFEPSKAGGGFVTLESGEKIEYHVLLLAQGSTWSGPPAFPRSDIAVKKHVQTLQAQFVKAKNIVIVGGGAVGYELAGEIRDSFPEKKVTIVHGAKQLLNDAYPTKFRIAAERLLRSRGIELILNDFVDAEETKEVQGITTRSGKELTTADFVVQARGPRANTAFVRSSIGANALSDRGYILVRPTLQLTEHNDIFAAGDAIDWKEQKQSAKSTVHGALAAKNIIAFLNKRKLKEYKGSTEIIALSNGKNAGLVYIDILWGITLGSWLARLKSKGLLMSFFKGEQGY